MGLRRQRKREAAWTAVEHEADAIIGARIAEGRPPPKVWKDAAERHTAKGLSAGAWYLPTARASEPPRRSASTRRPPPEIGDNLVLHEVRLPLAPAPRTTPGLLREATGKVRSPP